MSSLACLEIYFSMNLILSLSYAVFVGSQNLARRLAIGMDHRRLISVAQVLIFISVFAPIGLHLTPKDKLSPFTEFAFPSLPEELMNGSDKEALAPGKNAALHVRIRDLSPQTPSRFIDFQEWWSALDKNRVADGLLAGLLFGMLSAIVNLMFSCLRLRNLIQSSVIIKKYGSVRVSVSDRISIPFSLKAGVSSWIVSPSGLLDNQLDFSIAIKHEIQHHRQGDTRWAVISEMLQCMFWLNPFMPFWKRGIVELQEFSCDEAIIEKRGISPIDYGNCLVRVAEAALKNRQFFAGTVSMAAHSKDELYSNSLLRRRVEAFVVDLPASRRPVAGLFIGISASFITMGAALATGLALEPISGKKVNPGLARVDPAIQEIAERELADAVRSTDAEGGFAIVADPANGGIRAVANIDAAKEYETEHWALSQEISAGSLMKPLVAAVALNRGLTTLASKYSCGKGGSYRYGDHVYQDWKKGGWDHLSVKEMISLSSNTCAIRLGEKVGADNLRQMLIEYGFGPNGVAASFSEATTGKLPASDGSNRQKVIPEIALGYGFSSTPLEVLQIYGAIANDGNLMKPVPAQGPRQPGMLIRRVMSPEVAQTVRAMLEEVVERGTGKLAQSSLYTTAGKTGSSFKGEGSPGNGVNRKADLASFVGFAPASQPRIEVYVGIFKAGTPHGINGGIYAAPVFRKITEKVLKHLNIVPDKQLKL